MPQFLQQPTVFLTHHSDSLLKCYFDYLHSPEYIKVINHLVALM